MRRRNQLGNFSKDPCLTMHQPWASLLVNGIKRIEGRSWPSPVKGRLWIHAASKVPDTATIKAMENFYREIYALDGMTDLHFPEHYPVSRLIGCVEIVGCLRREELASWKAVPEGVRLEALTDFCWLCEQPQILLDPLKMRGDQGVYNLERKIIEAAVSGLLPVESPCSMKFPLPCTENHNSLGPGSLHLDKSENEALGAEKPSNLIAAIIGAQAAATQFSKKSTKPLKGTSVDNNMINNELVDKLKNTSVEEGRGKAAVEIDSKRNAEGKSIVDAEKQKQLGPKTWRKLDQHSAGSSL
ncbi:Activating signal cointegrator 1, partial [Bienertia sinuspersici]